MLSVEICSKYLESSFPIMLTTQDYQNICKGKLKQKRTAISFISFIFSLNIKGIKFICMMSLAGVNSEEFISPFPAVF